MGGYSAGNQDACGDIPIVQLGIAAEIAVSLTESSSKAQALWQVYQQKLAEARRRDAQEGASATGRENWIASR